MDEMGRGRERSAHTETKAVPEAPQAGPAIGAFGGFGAVTRHHDTICFHFKLYFVFLGHHLALALQQMLE